MLIRKEIGAPICDHSWRALARSLGMLLLVSLRSAPGAAEIPHPGWVVWQSNRADARTEIYLCSADGSNLKRLTTTGATHPSWAPDGRWISFTDEVGGTYVMRPDGSQRKKLFEGEPLFWLHDNSGLVGLKGGSFYLLDPDLDQSTLLYAQDDFVQLRGRSFFANGITHDNRYLLAGTDLYRDGHTGDNGSFEAGFAAVVLDLQHKDKVYFFGSGCWPFTPPAGPYVYHVCGDCPTKPDIYRLDLADLMTRSSYETEEAHENADWGHEYNPRISNDNQWMTYMASTGCHAGDTCDYEIFIHRLGAGSQERTRVTTDPYFDGYPDLFVGELWQPESKPQLLLTPAWLTFFQTADQPPLSQKITVKNNGGGQLGTLTTEVLYAGAEKDWLDLQLEQGKSPVTLQVTLRKTALPEGEHRATITVVAGNVQNSPQSAEVIFQVKTPASGNDGGPWNTDQGGSSGDGCALVYPAVSAERGSWSLVLLGGPMWMLLWQQRRRRKPPSAARNDALATAGSLVAAPLEIPQGFLRRALLGCSARLITRTSRDSCSNRLTY
jgi:hypothetical protein